MSVRRDIHPGRREVRLLLGAVGLAAFLPVACGNWPPNEDRLGGGSSGAPGEPGTCSGTPTPCSALATLSCGSTVGCKDLGSCAGTPTSLGASCVIRLPSECNATPGCYWSTICTGTPYGTCSASTRDACLIAPGCIWTPSSFGAGGSGGSTGTCQSFGVSCIGAASCDCGLTCVRQCPSCPPVCGNACAADADCIGTSGLGISTPYCQILPAGTTPGYSGLCAVSK